MIDEERVPLIELLPHNKNLPDKMKDKDVSLVTSVFLRTVWGWKRSTKFSVAQAEYFDSLANVADAIYRYNESAYRLGTAGQRVAREAEIENLEHELRKTELAHEIKKKQLAMGRLGKDNEVETNKLDEQLSGYKKRKGRQNASTNDDFVSKKERVVLEAVDQYVAGLTRIKPHIDKKNRTIDESAANGAISLGVEYAAISKEEAKTAKKEIQDMISNGLLEL